MAIAPTGAAADAISGAPAEAFCNGNDMASTAAVVRIATGHPNTGSRLEDKIVGSAMSRAPALAPVPAPGASFRGKTHNAAMHGRHQQPFRRDPDYVERALLLWPRLARARLRRVADDPRRIAELVVRRTSQPYDAVLAMLTRQNPALAPRQDPTPEPRRDQSVSCGPRPPLDGAVTFRVLRTEEGSEVRIGSLTPR
jgi:hypothetical protein